MHSLSKNALPFPTHTQYQPVLLTLATSTPSSKNPPSAQPILKPHSRLPSSPASHTPTEPALPQPLLKARHASLAHHTSLALDPPRGRRTHRPERPPDRTQHPFLGTCQQQLGPFCPHNTPFARRLQVARLTRRWHGCAGPEGIRVGEGGVED
jgi:hypothetical protein